MKRLLIIAIVLAGWIVLRPSPAQAQSGFGCCVTETGSCANNVTSQECAGENGSFFGGRSCNDPSITQCIGQTGSSTGTPAASQNNQTVQLPNPISCNDATCLIGQVVRYILGTIAVIATLMFVWGGVMMLTSGGSAERVKRAKETLTWATIGVVVILLSWVIIKAVLQALTKTS